MSHYTWSAFLRVAVVKQYCFLCLVSSTHTHSPSIFLPYYDVAWPPNCAASPLVPAKKLWAVQQSRGAGGLERRPQIGLVLAEPTMQVWPGVAADQCRLEPGQADLSPMGVRLGSGAETCCRNRLHVALHLQNRELVRFASRNLLGRPRWQTSSKKTEVGPTRMEVWTRDLTNSVSTSPNSS